jgi:hypothetical protein
MAAALRRSSRLRELTKASPQSPAPKTNKKKLLAVDADPEYQPASKKPPHHKPTPTDKNEKQEQLSRAFEFPDKVLLKVRDVVLFSYGTIIL